MRREYIYFPCDFYEWSKTEGLRNAHGAKGLLMAQCLWFNSAAIDDFDGVYSGMTTAEIGALAFLPEDKAELAPNGRDDELNKAVQTLLEFEFLSKNENGELVLVDWDRIANGREED